mgnify:CR=1 FL=1
MKLLFIIVALFVGNAFSQENIKLNKDRILYCLKDGAVDGGDYWYLEPEKRKLTRAFDMWDLEYYFKNNFSEPFGSFWVFSEEFAKNYDSISAYEYLKPEEEARRIERGYEHAQGWIKINTINLKYHWRQYWSRGKSNERIYDTYGSCTKYNTGINFD